MGNSDIKVIVKVGLTSNFNYFHREIKCIRVITAKELGKAIKVNPLSIVIIEGIVESEYSDMLEILDKSKIQSTVKVYFSLESDDNVTSGLADELEYDIYLNKTDVYNKIDSIIKKGYTVLESAKDEKIGVYLDSDLEVVSDAEIDKFEVTGEETEEGLEINIKILNIEKKELEEENKKLEKIILALEDEKEVYKKLLIDIENITEVLENPIEIQKYNDVCAELERVKAEKEETDKKILVLEEEKKELRRRISELEIAIVESNNSEIEVISAKLGELEIENSGLKNQLKESTDKYNEALKSSSTDSNKVNMIISQYKTIEDINKTLALNLKITQESLEAAEAERDSERQNVEILNQTINTLKSTLTAIPTRTNISDSHVEFKCVYNGTCMIIPVIGCSSQGISTTAVSLAQELAVENKVLLVDFDFLMPKINNWYSPDLISGRDKGVRTLLKSDNKEFNRLASSLVSKVYKARSGSIDLFCNNTEDGSLSPTDFKGVDFSNFFSTYGSNYTHIVIDLGKVGYSKWVDAIIKVITDVAFRTVVVTYSDSVDINTCYNKILEAGINIVNVMWLLNICRSTSIDADAKKMLAGKHYFMPISTDLYGKRSDFTKFKINKDRLDMLIDGLYVK